MFSHDVNIVWLEVGVDSVAQFCTRLGVKSNMLRSTLRDTTLTVRQSVPKSSIVSVLRLSMALFKLKF